jgi:beta-glucosidase
VAQLYTRQEESRVKQPLRQLRAFQRISLQPGETSVVDLTVAATDLGFWDVTRAQRCVEDATHSILVGRSCTDLRLAATVEVIGERIPPRSPTRIDATSFDEYCGTTLTTAAPERGDAVVSLEGGAWLAFDDVLLGAGINCRVAAGNSGSAPATIELRLDDPLHGSVLGQVALPASGTVVEHNCEARPTDRTDTGIHTVYAVFSAPDIVLESFGL